MNIIPSRRTICDFLGIPEEECLSKKLKSITKDDIRFCIDFVIYLAIKIQEKFHELKIP